MITSICKEYYQFLLGQGVLGGLSTGLLFTPAISCISHYFSRHRGLAIGLCAAGSSLGGLILPIALNHALYSKRLGFGWGVRAVGFAILGLLAVACALVKERLPPRRGKLFLPRAFLQPSFTTLTAAIFFSFWGMWIPYFFIVSFAIEKVHMSGDLAFYTLSITNGASLFGRIIPGFLADRFGRLRMLVCVYATNAIVLLCWLRVSSSAGLLVWVAFFGFTSGAIISLYPASVAQVTPSPQQIGTYMGQASFVVSIAGLTGAPIAGALIRNYGYDKAAIFAGVSLVACTILAAIATVLHLRKGQLER
ncbi:major facilitator superfamily domain-containing protein [Aspergillus pseudoustus]|uniref:Major facilitator superfamily domain-containing protein n=1 Tax=Aspergillus pseudoustus TaxID=1810923 RepID=A0ABR4J751_9EURO